MSEVTGVIQAIKERSLNNGKKAYDIQVAGDWYGAGLYAPKAKEGDYVTFRVAYNGNFKNVERNSLKVSANKQTDAAPVANVRAAVSSFDARQDTISRQAASNTAVAWITLLHAAGALPAPKTKGSAQATLDMIRAQYEKEFYESNTGVEWKSISPSRPAHEEPEQNEEHPEDESWQ